jgi:hypothetical protein
MKVKYHSEKLLINHPDRALYNKNINSINIFIKDHTVDSDQYFTTPKNMS